MIKKIFDNKIWQLFHTESQQAFVSEYAVTYPKELVKNGTFEGALAEAAFLLSLEQNRHAISPYNFNNNNNNKIIYHN